MPLHANQTPAVTVQSNMLGSAARIRSLDAIRGIAIAMVLAWHFFVEKLFLKQL